MLLVHPLNGVKQDLDVWVERALADWNVDEGDGIGHLGNLGTFVNQFELNQDDLVFDVLQVILIIECLRFLESTVLQVR